MISEYENKNTLKGRLGPDGFKRYVEKKLQEAEKKKAEVALDAERSGMLPERAKQYAELWFKRIKDSWDNA